MSYNALNIELQTYGWNSRKKIYFEKFVDKIRLNSEFSLFEIGLAL